MQLLGEDPEREGLLDTPMRAAKAMSFYTKGYDDTIGNAVKKVIITQPLLFEQIMGDPWIFNRPPYGVDWLWESLGDLNLNFECKFKVFIELI
jgi:hypothetical protein